MAFYKKATVDFLIGYHFRKILEDTNSSPPHPLYPDLKHFSNHIPRIVQFWAEQLKVEHPYEKTNYDLINIHRSLNVRKGEVGRWILLFNETLAELSGESKTHQYICDELSRKVSHFQKIFLEKLF